MYPKGWQKRQTCELRCYFAELKDWIDYPVFVDVHRSQVTIEEQLIRVDVDGTLPPAFAAQGPLRIYQTPERRSCKKNRML